MTLNSGDIDGFKCARVLGVAGGGGASAPLSTLTALMYRAMDNASHMKILFLVTKKPRCLFFSSYNFVT